MKHACRICLKVINDFNFLAFKTHESSQIKMQLLFCVPEIVVDLVKDAVFCKSCVSALHSAYNFKNLCLRTEERIKNLKISHSKSINIMDSLYDLLQRTSSVCEDNREWKGFVDKPRMNILLSDEDLANGQNLNTETQRSVTVPIESFNKIINANNVTSNGFSKLSQQTSVDELDSLSDDALWNTSVQPLAYEEEVKNEYKDITIDEDFSLPKMEPLWSYEGYENTSFEDAKSGDCTTDNENNRASVQTNTVIQDCFVKLSRLPNNISYNNVNRSYYKGDCNLCSAQKWHLKQHLKSQTGEKPFICNVCDYRFAEQSDLQRHLKLQTGEKQFSCDVCTFCFTNKSRLQRHLRTHTGEKPFICNVCDYRFAHKSSLKDHLKIHTGEKPFVCNVCDYRFAHRSSLKVHLRRHTGEKPFVCNVCDYRSAQQSDLQKHLRRHTGEKPYSCDVCTFCFTNKSHLQRHLRTHTGEKPFVCNVCDYRFAYKSSLKVHLQKHSSEKPFVCNVCDYRSAEQSDFKDHLKIHTGEKPYSCDVCTSRFTQKSHLQRHLRIHAGEKT